MYLGSNQKKEDAFAINISPNPNNGQMQVSYVLREKSDLTIVIHDSQGKQIFSHNYKGEKSGNLNINLGNPTSGIYNLSIESDGVHITKKFVVR